MPDLKKRPKHGFKQLLLNFASDCKGNIGIMFAVAALPMCLAIGAAIDYSVMTADIQKAQDTSDAAVLHAAREYYNTYAKDKASLSGDTSAQHHLLNEIYTGEYDVETTIGSGGTGKLIIQSSVFGTSRHAFMGIIGKAETKWTATSYSEVTVPQIEIMLVIDASASMRGVKFNQLKAALGKFVDDVAPYKVGDSHVAITMLPYAENINFGQEASVWASSAYNNLNKGNFNGCFKFSKADRAGFLKPAAYNGQFKGVPYCPPAEAVLFSTDSADLRQSIKDMGVGYGTDSTLGLIWAERLLDPAWRRAASRFSENQPINLTTKTKKVVVLLTDGAIAITDKNQNGKKDSSRLIRNNRKSSISDFSKQCDTLRKVENLNLHAVAYSINNKQFENVLKKCVSGSGEYFDTEVGDLSAVFKKISEDLLPIRIAR